MKKERGGVLSKTEALVRIAGGTSTGGSSVATQLGWLAGEGRGTYKSQRRWSRIGRMERLTEGKRGRASKKTVDTFRRQQREPRIAGRNSKQF